MSKLTKAIFVATEGLLSDPGSNEPRYRAGQVVVVQRARRAPIASKLAALQAALPAPRFVAAGQEQPPASRERLVSPDFAQEGIDLFEVWAAVPRALEGTTTAEIVRQAQAGVLPIDRWKVSLEVRARRNWSHYTAEEVRQHVLSLQLQVDEASIYEGFYATLPGPDVAIFNPNAKGMDQHRNGQPIRLPNPPRYPNGKIVEGHEYLLGGTYIRSRKHHREATKGMIHAGPGFTDHVDRIKARRRDEQWQKSKHKLAEVMRHCPDDFFDPVTCADDGALLQATEKVTPE